MKLDAAPGQPSRGESGFALLIVLWTLVLISLLLVMVAASAPDAQLATNLRGAAELEAAADAAIHTAIFNLMQAGGFTTGNQVPAVRLPGAAIRVEVVSQAGLVNPNVASPELMRALLLRLGANARMADSVASAIADWRTPGVGPRPNGAKAPQYRNAGLGYGPPGAPFETLSELRDVLGMTPALLAALTPHLTLYWDSDPVSDFAQPIVRAALRDVGITRRAGQGNSQVVRITADVNRADGTRATRQAFIRLGASPNRRGWRVLAWASWHR